VLAANARECVLGEGWQRPVQALSHAADGPVQGFVRLPLRLVVCCCSLGQLAPALRMCMCMCMCKCVGMDGGWGGACDAALTSSSPSLTSSSPSHLTQSLTWWPGCAHSPGPAQ
jgi:hypothetical protein